jgi:hypothetical protein
MLPWRYALTGVESISGVAVLQGKLTMYSSKQEAIDCLTASLRAELVEAGYAYLANFTLSDHPLDVVKLTRGDYLKVLVGELTEDDDGDWEFYGLPTQIGRASCRERVSSSG